MALSQIVGMFIEVKMIVGFELDMVGSMEIFEGTTTDWKCHLSFGHKNSKTILRFSRKEHFDMMFLKRF